MRRDQNPSRRVAMAAALAAAMSAGGLQAATYTHAEARTFLRTRCAACHTGPKPSGGFSIAAASDAGSLLENPRLWARMMRRVRDGDMPPKVTLPEAERDGFTGWVDHNLRTAACADGITPRAFPLKRLNRSEYAATVRDLLGIQVNAGASLPADGAGGEGFDNAAETLIVSPIHAEKYLEAARLGLEYGFKDPRSRVKFLVAEPGGKWSDGEAARRNLENFVTRAFRRPPQTGEVERYLALYEAGRARGDSFDLAMQFAMQGVMVSPEFLFRMEEGNEAPEPRMAGHHAMASRLSYFLWGSMPDAELFLLAESGRLHDESVLRGQVARMLNDVKSLEFAESFVEQWLGTRELGRDIKPDEKLFPEYYDDELRSALKYEPILFFQEVLGRNLPVETLIDSEFTYLNTKLQKHYGLKIERKERLRQQPLHVELPEGSHRGGLLGMGAVLAVSSLPNRTSPVLRGKWILDAILGTPAPPPPPNVPPLEDNAAGEKPKTVRARLELHRTNPVCASCHNRIDPLGFALDNFDVLGRWRSEEAGEPLDTGGQMPDGTRFNGPEQFKQILLERREDFARHLTTKLLGYALGRGLTLEDHCAVEQIVAKLKRDGYGARLLIEEIVLSAPFRYQPGTAPGLAVRIEGGSE
ncbi:MAG: DUF1592 domain-containing protein [Bryobacteraceae bacterium]